MLFNGFPECGAVGVCLNVLWERVPENGRAIEKGFPVTGSACLWEKGISEKNPYVTGFVLAHRAILSHFHPCRPTFMQYPA